MLTRESGACLPAFAVVPMLIWLKVARDLSGEAFEMTRYFAHPSGDGQIEVAGGIRGFVFAWLLGPLYFAAKHAWFAALIAILFEPLIFFSGIELGDLVSPNSWRGFGLVAALLQTMLVLMLHDGPAYAYRRRGWDEVLQLTHALKEPRLTIRKEPVPPLLLRHQAH